MRPGNRLSFEYSIPCTSLVRPVLDRGYDVGRCSRALFVL